MRCEAIEPNLAAFIDGELDEAARASVESHLRECRQCRESVRDMRLGSAVLSKWQGARPTISLVDVVRRRIEAEDARRDEGVTTTIEEVRRKVRVPLFPAWLTSRRIAVAAVALLAFAGGIFMLTWTPESAVDPVVRRTRAASSIARMATSAEDAHTAEIAVEGVLTELWGARTPEPDPIVSMSVVATILRTARTPEGAKHAGRLLEMMAAEPVAMGAKRRAIDFAAITGDCLVALVTMQQACAQEAPTDLDEALKEALEFERNGELDRAIGEYRKAAVKGTGRLLALRSYIHEANLEMKLGRIDEAAQALEKAYAMTKPRTFNRDVVEELQTRVARAKDLRGKISKLQAELLATEKQFILLSEIGSLQVKAGDVKGARETWSRIVRDYDRAGFEKERLHARLMTGWCDAQLNRHDAAFETFDALAGDAAAVDMTVAILAQYERARTLQVTGRTALAVKDYRDLANCGAGVSPRCTAALQFQVGYIYLTELGMDAEAAEAFRTLEDERYRDDPFARLARELTPRSGS